MGKRAYAKCAPQADALCCIADTPVNNTKHHMNLSAIARAFLLLDVPISKEMTHFAVFHFLADRTIGRAFGTVSRLSVCPSSVCNVLYCGKKAWQSDKKRKSV